MLGWSKVSRIQGSKGARIGPEYVPRARVYAISTDFQTKIITGGLHGSSFKKVRRRSWIKTFIQEESFFEIIAWKEQIGNRLPIWNVSFCLAQDTTIWRYICYLRIRTLNIDLFSIILINYGCGILLSGN